MNIAVIFAGGTGRRMHTGGLPKQFLEVNGVPIIVHTLRVFQRCSAIDAVVVACLADYLDWMRELTETYRLSKVKRIVPGGKTGQESIYHGLCAAKELTREKSVVLIHDGVRPLIEEDLIVRNIQSVREHGSAISAVKAKETVILGGEDNCAKSATERESTFFARAPQSFWLDELLSCHEASIREGREFIDSCTMMMHYGKRVRMVETSYQNIKITTPDDYYIFKALLAARENAQILGMN